MTIAFESFVIQVARECSIEATARLCGVSWDQGWNIQNYAIKWASPRLLAGED
jgi:hypothetical protein